MIFVNLPVADVARATGFYTALGFERDPRFSGDHASAMQWSDAIVVMLLQRDVFATFTPKRIADPAQEVGALLSLSLDSRDAVDGIAAAALAAGGSEVHAAEDMGYMYSRAFADPDGHGWGVLHMDVAAMLAAQAGEATA
ncbi:VOC family protein [Sphingomonas silueang]|uniref:VOC family protein n=1 Tax=Sphingomonas silueang TaxID=3156617 RepID=UPI0032B33511